MSAPPPPSAEIDVAGAEGARFRVRRHGDPRAATRLFVSHGNGFAIDGYRHFWSRFVAGFEVVLFDMRSHGHNPPADPPGHDYPHMVCDIDAIAGAVDAAFGAKPSAGLFHSMSAQAALIQAMQGTPRFDALVLFDPPNVPPEGHELRPAMVAYEDKLERWALGRRACFDDPAQLAAEYAGTRSGRRWEAGADRLMAQAVLRRCAGAGWALACPREREAAMYRDGIALGLWPTRADLPVPVVLIGADPKAPHPAATGLANRALAAEGGFAYRAIPGTSHLLQLEEPAACAEAALDSLHRFGLA